MPLSTIRVANNCITRARNLLAASTSPNIALGTREDCRRLALVMSVVALDAYVHWTVFLKLSTVRQRADIPKGLQRLDLAFGDIASLADSAVSARHRGTAFRPWVQVKNAVQKRLQQMTIQNSNAVAEALSFLGITSLWRKVAQRLTLSADVVTSRLNSIVARRNQIVHEGDLQRHQRPRRVSHNSITRAGVANDIAFMENLIDAMHAEILEQERGAG